MQAGERQVAPTLEGIRRDHVSRYEWAARQLPPAARVIDFACGVGYGAQILAAAGHRVAAFDRDPEALAYAAKHYAHPRAKFARADAVRPARLGRHDAAVCFETIEHLKDPRALLKALRGAAAQLLASVPNEDVTPYQRADGSTVTFHHRHYTRAQFEALLNETGWEVEQWLGQAGPESEVEPGVRGRPLIAVAARGKIRRAAAPTGPEHVCILGMGPSARQYLEITKRVGGRHKFADETWAINALGDVFACDRIFHMDDVRIQQIRAEARPGSNIAAMLDWMRRTKTPIYTSRLHKDYPSLVAFPLEAVVNSTGYAYFNSTAAYAVAYAIHIGAKKISIFGFDYTYPDAHHAEKGRACVEFWLGIAAARGIKLSIPNTSSLMDAMYQQTERLYGYDTLDVKLGKGRGGKRVAVRFTERKGPPPTAAAIEKRYDHSQHPAQQVAAPKEAT